MDPSADEASATPSAGAFESRAFPRRRGLVLLDWLTPVFMVLIATNNEGGWRIAWLLLVFPASFSLLRRPFRHGFVVDARGVVDIRDEERRLWDWDDTIAVWSGREPCDLVGVDRRGRHGWLVPTERVDGEAGRAIAAAIEASARAAGVRVARVERHIPRVWPFDQLRFASMRRQLGIDRGPWRERALERLGLGPRGWRGRPRSWHLR